MTACSACSILLARSCLQAPSTARCGPAAVLSELPHSTKLKPGPLQGFVQFRVRGEPIHLDVVRVAGRARWTAQKLSIRSLSQPVVCRMH